MRGNSSNTFWRKKTDKVITYDIRSRNTENNRKFREKYSKTPFSEPSHHNNDSFFQRSQEIHKTHHYDQEEEEENPNFQNDPFRTTPEITANLLEIMRMLGKEEFDEGDFENQDRLVKRLENIKRTIMRMRADEEPEKDNDKENFTTPRQEKPVTARDFTSEKQTIEIENIRLREENLRLREVLHNRSLAKEKNQSAASSESMVKIEFIRETPFLNIKK